MKLPITPETRPSRVPDPLNRPVHAASRPSRTGKVKSTSKRSSTVPPRPVVRKTTTVTSPIFEPFQNILLKHAPTIAEPGEYWLALKDGREPWPVVICSEEMIEMFFSDKPRPENARRADGTWRKRLRPRGVLTGQKCFPAMYLGTWKLCWVPWNRLQPLDIQMANSNLQEIDEQGMDSEDLAKAYVEVIEQWDNHNIQYWIDKLLALRLTEDGVMIVKTTKLTKRKRPGPPMFKNPLNLSRFLDGDNVDDDGNLFSHVKKEPKEDIAIDMSFQHDDTLYDVSDTEEPHQRAKAERYSRSSASVAPSLYTPRTTPAKSKVGRSPQDADKVRIFVGNPHQQFVVKKSELEKRSPLLFGLVSHHRAEGSYIMSPVLSNISPEDFKTIAEYLDHGEFRPNLLDDGTRWARLENVGTKAKRAEELTLSGIRYCHAQQLELSELQLLIFRKVKALGHYPAFELLSAVHLMYREGPPDHKEMHEFFVNHLARHFYELLLEDLARFVELLQGHPELARCVFERLGMVGEFKEEAGMEEGLEGMKSEDEGSGPL